MKGSNSSKIIFGDFDISLSLMHRKSSQMTSKEIIKLWYLHAIEYYSAIN